MTTEERCLPFSFVASSYSPLLLGFLSTSLRPQPLQQPLSVLISVTGGNLAAANYSPHTHTEPKRVLGTGCSCRGFPEQRRAWLLPRKRVLQKHHLRVQLKIRTRAQMTVKHRKPRPQKGSEHTTDRTTVCYPDRPRHIILTPPRIFKITHRRITIEEQRRGGACSVFSECVCVCVCVCVCWGGKAI